MKAEEIYVLNRALDGKDIYSLPSLSQLKLSELLAETIKDELVEKGILKSKSELSEKGMILLSRLKQFKEAKKHIVFNNIAMGVSDSTNAAAILYNPLKNDYQFLMIDASDSLSQLYDAFPFLDTKSKSEDGFKEILSYEELRKKYNLSEEPYLRLKTKKNEKETDEIYFFKNDMQYVYDCRKSLLCIKTYEELHSSLAERMSA